MSNEDYHGGGASPPQERAAYSRLFKEASAAKLSVGTVHVYLLDKAGTPLSSLHVAEACKPGKLLQALTATAEKLGVAPGAPVVKPAGVSRPPGAKPGDLVLHLTARSLDQRGCWGDFPVENWLVLKDSQWRKLLPANAVAGAEHEVDSETTALLLQHFYPATENNDPLKNLLDEKWLRVKVVEARADLVRARVEGRLKMQHSFYHKPDDKLVDATLSGFIEFNPKATQAVPKVRLVTQDATYNGGKFGVAVRSVEKTKVAARPQ